MEKRSENKSKVKTVILIVVIVFFTLFVILPLLFSLFTSDNFGLGNVALIPIEGILTVNGASTFGQSAVSSAEIAGFIKEANENSQVQVILLEINSPGGSAVASDEIASAIKQSKKPVVALIREVGASGGYWIASAANYVIANKMSITGSIGVVSSYLEFSRLLEEYGIGYERLVSGEHKDMGTPFQRLTVEEKAIFQKKLDKIHDFFIEEIAQNRKLSILKVKEIATGEFFLGVEALELGLVDQLGDKTTAEEYLKTKYNLDIITYVTYQREAGFLELLSGVFSHFSFLLSVLFS